MKKTIYVCDGCKQELSDNPGDNGRRFDCGREPFLTGIAKEGGRPFPFSLCFDPVVSGNPPRATLGAKDGPDLCYNCVNAIVDDALQHLRDKIVGAPKAQL